MRRKTIKKFILWAALVANFGANAFAMVYIKYYNKDSQKHVFTVKMDGQMSRSNSDVR